MINGSKTIFLIASCEIVWVEITDIISFLEKSEQKQKNRQRSALGNFRSSKLKKQLLLMGKPFDICCYVGRLQIMIAC